MMPVTVMMTNLCHFHQVATAYCRFHPWSYHSVQSDDKLDFMETVTQHILIWANRICSQILNKYMNLGQRFVHC